MPATQSGRSGWGKRLSSGRATHWSIGSAMIAAKPTVTRNTKPLAARDRLKSRNSKAKTSSTTAKLPGAATNQPIFDSSKKPMRGLAGLLLQLEIVIASGAKQSRATVSNPWIASPAARNDGRLWHDELMPRLDGRREMTAERRRQLALARDLDPLEPQPGGHLPQVPGKRGDEGCRILTRLRMGRGHAQGAGSAVRFQIDASDQAVAEKEWQHVVAVQPPRGRRVDLDPVAETPDALRPVAFPDQGVERREQRL